MKRALCLCACLLSPSLVRAEPPPGEPTEYQFEDELLQGDLVRPGGEVLLVRRKGGRASLIEVRSSYLDRLTKSIEDL